MKRCKKCNLEVNSIRKTCPLCLSILEDDGKDYNKKFPSPTFLPHKKSLFLRILAFLSVIAIFVSIVVNVMTYTEGGSRWSVIVIFNIGYFWLLIKSTFRRDGNIAIRLVVQTIAVSLLLYIIDYFGGNFRWSINYIIPFITMASLLSIVSLSIGSRYRFINHFLHIITAILLGFIPLVFWFFGLLDILWPSLAAATLSFVCIIGLIIIGDKETMEEIKKRLHI